MLTAVQASERVGLARAKDRLARALRLLAGQETYSIGEPGISFDERLAVQEFDGSLHEGWRT